jgi:N-acetylmuramoyl-L-alanine amidase
MSLCVKDKVRLAKKKRLKQIIRSFRMYARKVTPGIAAIVMALALIFSWTRPLRSDNFVFYLPSSHNVVPLKTFGKADYLPLLTVLNLVGRVDALRESPGKLRIWFGNTLLQVGDDNRKIGVNKSTARLSMPTRLEEGQWFVPVDFLSVVLPRIIAEGVDYRAGDHRIFIGGNKPSTFSVRLSEIPNGTRLQMEFSSPLTYQTAARNGKWILFLGNHPVEPLEQTFMFDSPYVRMLEFDDQDGVPKLILTPASPGLDLHPALEDGGRVLRADVVKPVQPEQPPPVETAQSQPSVPMTASQPARPEEPPASPSQASGPTVVLDPGHGGQDSGVQGSNGIVEKNLVSQIAVRVRATLVATRNYRVLLTRLGDSDPDFDQRTQIANTARATYFISFHAGNLNSRTPRVAVYSYEPPDPAAFVPTVPRPIFVSWSSIQAFHLDESKLLAQAVRDQFAGPPDVLISSPGRAPVRVLRSVDAPAVAIEVGSLGPTLDSSGLLAADFQQRIANAVLAALQSLSRKAS